MTSRTICCSVIIPCALYGCELWNRYSSTDMQNLETSHRFCQGLKQRTPTDLALNTINLNYIETIINYRKLQFYCVVYLVNTWLNKYFWTYWLDIYIMIKQTSGFIPDIYRLLQNYNLENVVWSDIVPYFITNNLGIRYWLKLYWKDRMVNISRRPGFERNISTG